jgi:hypothetical protein
LAAALAGAALLSPQAGMSASGGVFAPFVGSWKGGGQVTVNDGHKERISCRATYSAAENGGSLTQSLVCAGDSYRFQVESYIEADGQNLNGHWEERTRAVEGQLTGRVTGGLFQGNIQGAAFSAQMTLNSTDKQQVVSIKPQGASFSSVDMVLARQR